MTPTGANHRGTVVVGVDGSAGSQLALRWAARQATLMGARLRVVTAWEFPMSYGWAPQLPPGLDPSDDAEKMLREVVDDVVGSEGHIEVETVVLEGQPAPTLLDAAKDADLLVVGTRGHGELAGIFCGSVGERCVTRATCPVVVVRSNGGLSHAT